ncbi:hypothetical protein BV898_18571 [Hypsibius exemplaris]|uniref:UPAR/Ly6 domain-containing protein n=1 Tax=Hypsibius exemplaris TaxID=2072580 RepID=A0A9X6RNL2_HYPEX|nr:hypothetical protein BV898_18571 [Hypsibius exemplaris]
MARALAITFFLVISLASICSALKCYQCSFVESLPASDTNQVNCKDPFNITGIRTIEQNETGVDCQRCTQGKVTRVAGNVTLVIVARDCLTVGENDDGAPTCTSDLCNTGNATDVVAPTGAPNGMPKLVASAGLAVLGALLIFC